MKLLKQMLLLSLVLVSFQSSASLLIEPHVAYGMLGTADYTLLGQTAKYTYSGPQYGAKLGYQFLGLMAGLDYTHSTAKIKTEILGVTTESDNGRDQFGAFVGYKFPILLRVWAGYYFTDKSTTTSSGSSNGDYTSGTGTELGLGFTGLPFLSLNLMYRQSSYDKNYDASTGSTSTLNPKLDTSEIAVGVSIPLNL